MDAFQSTSNQLTLALSRGHISEEALPLLRAASIEATENPETSRKLILPTSDPALHVIIVHASDVPTYVQYGTVDFGVAGRDVLVEHNMTNLYAPIDLNITRCRMSAAVPKDFDYTSAVRQGARLSVVTKYLNTTREHLAKEDVHVDLIKLYGSTKLGPLVGLADAIVDLVSADDALRANNLVGVEEVMQVPPRLVVNRAALKLKRSRLAPILDALEHASATNACAGEAA